MMFFGSFSVKLMRANGPKQRWLARTFLMELLLQLVVMVVHLHFDPTRASR